MSVNSSVNKNSSLDMINVKFYLDKTDKNNMHPIHLVIRQKSVQIKVSTGEKVSKSDWDSRKQVVKSSNGQYDCMNKFLSFLKQEIETYFEGQPHSNFTDKKVKDKIQGLINQRKENLDIKLVCSDDLEDAYEKKKGITFIDLFAGAGGFSEGFLQSETSTKYYDFILASDINDNCELTHVVRYNHQLGLNTRFLRQDITEPDFLNNLLLQIGDNPVDVVCGGPPCQSFSLAGKRKRFDKKDDLFSHYLEVIKVLRPKYFVMENVKGILTKERGKIKEMILQEIRSIIDLEEFHQLKDFILELKKKSRGDLFLIDCYLQRLSFEDNEKDLSKVRDEYILNIENRFRLLIPKIVDYKTSKTDPNINTIRHGFNLLRRGHELSYIRKKVIQEKAYCDLDNDDFTQYFDEFLSTIEPDTIIDTINNAFKRLKPAKEFKEKVEDIIKSLEIFNYSFDQCVEEIRPYVKKHNRIREFEKILSKIRLYNIDQPFVALASDYGVPQNRERVLFIGCRKDQKLISSIPATVTGKEKTTVFEALYDLDFVGNDDEKFDYETVNIRTKYNGTSTALEGLLRKREGNGKISGQGMTFSEWSKKGRLNGRFKNMKNPFYVRNFEDLEKNLSLVAPLHNHKTSKQNNTVIKRLGIILTSGNYDMAKEGLKEANLDSEKRNYNVLKPDSQSPTVMTIPDDYIHFSSPRPLTVREMARLQSFDDSFVFQGKRSTGGNKRKHEVPQFTLVGNAVPPLLARAVAFEILKNIK